LPWYSYLKAEPNRGVPDELKEQESGEDHDVKRERLQRDLLDTSHRPADNVPLFTELMAGNGIITLPLPDSTRQCLLVFSTPLKAADYRRMQLSAGPPSTYLSSSPLQLVKAFADLARSEVDSTAIDRCPRCNIGVVSQLRLPTSADTLISLWAIQKGSELARADLYLTYAAKCMGAGNLDTARDVVLETVGHVSFEDPRVHYMLGEIALRLRDRKLLREARAFLAFLKQDYLLMRLDEASRAI
jgi:hypothetical protein